MAMRDEPKVYLKRLTDRSLDPVKDVGSSRQQDGGRLPRPPRVGQSEWKSYQARLNPELTPYR